MINFNYEKLQGLEQKYIDVIKAFVEQNDLSAVSVGHHELEYGCCANVSEYVTKSANDVVYESHVKFYDVQCLAKGFEKVFLTDKAKAQLCKDYDEQGDYMLWKGQGNEYVLKVGDFLVLGPQDLHAPCFDCNGNKSSVKKIVFKIPTNG